MGLNLGMSAIQRIKWCGTRGMKWNHLRHKLQYLSLHNESPEVIVLHVGSNDLSSVPVSVLRSVMRTDILFLHDLFPNAKLVISALLPRLNWNVECFPVDKLDKKRKLLNRFLKRLVYHLGGIRR